MGVREAKKEDSDAIHKIAKQNSLSEKEHSYTVINFIDRYYLAGYNRLHYL